VIHYLSGDATAPIGSGHKFIILVCNDRGFWNKGFVLSLSHKWREPEAAYSAWVRHKKLFELGNIQRVIVAPDITVFNMLAQNGIRSAANPKPIRLRRARQMPRKNRGAGERVLCNRSSAANRLRSRGRRLASSFVNP
jgi:hypothetical protein